MAGAKTAPLGGLGGVFRKWGMGQTKTKVLNQDQSVAIRPATGMKGIYVKLRGSLVEPLSKVSNRNGFINDAIQNKLEDEGLVK